MIAATASSTAATAATALSRCGPAVPLPKDMLMTLTPSPSAKATVRRYGWQQMRALVSAL